MQLIQSDSLYLRTLIYKQFMQLRLRKAIFTLIFSIATLLGYGQSFLSEYPKLTTQNLEEFFIAWKSYSDSIASKATKYDNLIDSIQGIEYAPKMPQENPSRYFVLPQYIKITEICYANNLIAVMRRTSWSTGDVIWYIKVNDKFVRQPVPVCEWVE